MREITQVEVATALTGALVKGDPDISEARVWTKKGVRVYFSEHGSPIGYLEVRLGDGPAAIGGDSVERGNIPKIIATVMKGVRVVAPAKTELSLEEAGRRLADELGRGGELTAKLWTKKGVRIYLHGAGGAELGWLELKAGSELVSNRSQLDTGRLANAITAAIGGARVRAPADPARGAQFLGAIAANPEDDGVRAVYADWLIETGDALARARGEFINAQLGSAAAAQKRARELLAEHEDDWLTDLRGSRAQRWDFERGFVSKASMSGIELKKTVPNLLAREPALRALRLTGVSIFDLVELAKSPILGRLEHLELVGHDFASGGPRTGLMELAATKLAKRLRILDLRALKMFEPERGVIELARAKGMPALEEIDLRGHLLTEPSAKALLASKLPALRSVRFTRCADKNVAAALKRQFPATT